MNDSILVTGMGICSPLGSSLDDVLLALQTGKSGIRPIESFDCSKLTMRHLGEVTCIPNSENYPPSLYEIWDRGTRMAMHAAGEALRDSKLSASQLASGRIGVCVGTSGSGQYQNIRFNLDKSFPIDSTLAFYLSRNSPHFQSSQIAAHYGILGPNFAIGAATAGGGIAFATAAAWLRSGRVDAVLVGGSEAVILLNLLGFDQLGLTLPHPCTPFHGAAGMTFGEGAGFLVLETEPSARRRLSPARAELRGVAIRADGFDPILFDPSGSGQSRAMHAALAQASLEPEDIDWIRASGTGGRDQDLAETIAVKSVFKQPPPISSLEPYLGHANGAGPAIQLVAAILCLENNLIPPTLVSGEVRPGCDLDYVTQGVRHQSLQHIMCNTLAFGGTNCAIVVSKPASRPTALTAHPTLPTLSPSPTLPPSPPLPTSRRKHGLGHDPAADEIVITGIGLVSPLGCGGHQLAERFFQQQNWLSQDDRLSSATDLRLGAVQSFSPRHHCPSVKLRGIEPLTQYAAGAVSLALEDAKLRYPQLQANRVGVVSAISRPSGSVFERLFVELQLNGFRPLVGKLMLRMGRFMVASQLAHWFDLRGHSSTISLGIGSGLHALVSAVDQLRSDPSLDAIVVVACDELNTFTLKLMQQGGVLAENNENWQLYSPLSQGYVPGEGAVAVIVERRQHAEARRAPVLAEVVGSGLSFDGLAGKSLETNDSRAFWDAPDLSAQHLGRCLETALQAAQLNPQDIDLVMGNGTGIWDWDQKEQLGLQRTFGSEFNFACINDQIGLCESASGLFNLATAVATLESQTIPEFAHRRARSGQQTGPEAGTAVAVSTAKASMTHALVTACTEQGQNAAVILRREVAGD